METNVDVTDYDFYVDKNDIYIPIEPNKYFYNAIDDLQPTMNEYLNIKQISIYAYEINNEHMYPFLKFLLCKNDMNIPIISTSCFIDTNYELNSENVKNAAIYHIFKLISNKYVGSLDDYLKNIIFNGFYVNDTNLCIFFNLTDCNLAHFDLLSSSEHLWFGIIDEIVNQKHVCNFKIHEDVTNFFIKNPDFCFLYNKEGDKYITPTIGYVGKHEKFLNFTFVFGERKNENGIMGPFYYFTDFFNAIKQGGWSPDNKPEYSYGKLLTINEKGKYYRGGIIRFVLFMEKTKVIHNLNDINGNCEKDICNDSNDWVNDSNDWVNDSNDWVNNYDSVFIGNNLLTDSPMIILKNYNQQVPLTYHYINNDLLGEIYEKEKYFIK
jgi:hypothetical protein